MAAFISSSPASCSTTGRPEFTHVPPCRRLHGHLVSVTGRARLQQSLAAGSSPNSTGGHKQGQAQKLQKWGLAGVVAYGALNTLYYSVAFLFCWTQLANVPRGQGLAAATQAFVKVFATVWAGSQITKAARAGGALLLAPIADGLLERAVTRFHFQSKRQAFLAFLGICISTALTLFALVVLAWK